MYIIWVRTIDLLRGMPSNGVPTEPRVHIAEEHKCILQIINSRRSAILATIKFMLPSDKMFCDVKCCYR